MIRRIKKFFTQLDQPSFATNGFLLPLYKSILYDILFILTSGRYRLGDNYENKFDRGSN